MEKDIKFGAYFWILYSGEKMVCQFLNFTGRSSPSSSTPIASSTPGALPSSGPTTAKFTPRWTPRTSWTCTACARASFSARRMIYTWSCRSSSTVSRTMSRFLTSLFIFIQAQEEEMKTIHNTAVVQQEVCQSILLLKA